jgi:hypothetical protein
VAQPHQPRHRARHASSGRSVAFSDLAALVRGSRTRIGSTVAKVSSVGAAGGLAVALVVPGQSAAASAVAEPSADRASADLAAALLDERAEAQVSRAVSRAAAAPAVALRAPAVPAPVAAPTFGALSFTAVEKPPPPPPPPAASSGRSSGSGGGSAPRGGGGYDWAAANACSCARGLTQNAMGVLAAVKASFPGMTNIGGVRPDSMPDHPSGRALDFMTSDRGYGDAIASMLIGRAGELNIEYIIWRQRIWMPSSGWRTMEDRGGVTANHYDHVHVTVR